MSEHEIALPGRGIKPLASLLAHPRLAVAAAALVLVAGVPAAWIHGTPRYQTEAAIQVAPRYMRNLREDQELDLPSNTQYRQFVENQRRSVGRYDVLRDALHRLGDKRNLWQKPDESERRAIDRLREQLLVASVPDTYLIRLSLEGRAPDGMADIVNAVATTFIERMKSEQIYGADERTKHLKVREQELLQVISERATHRSEIARELGLTTFNESTPNPYDRLLADLRAKLSDARQRRMDADAALAAFKAHGDTNVTVRSVQDAVLNDPGLNSLKGALSNRRALLLTQQSGLRGDHPGNQDLQRELTEIDSEITTQTQKLEAGVRANLLARLQSTAVQASAVESGLQQGLHELEAQATDFARMFQEAMTLTADIAQSRSELDKVRERINYLDVESTSLGFLRLVNPALEPEIPFGPGRKKLLLLALLASLAAGISAPVLRDLLDRRVHTVNDVQRLLGIVPAGWQVSHTDTASRLFAAEQLRRMAATLIRNRDSRKQRVFGFTACKPGGGTTSLVLDLANTLRGLGYTVLTVEANGKHRDPRFVGDRPGLVELLRGQTDTKAVVLTASESMPARVAISGHVSGEPVALERLDLLTAALQEWAGEYDFVLVDMPALLTSADAELLVRAIGQVLLVVEAGAVSKGEVTRAGRLLQTLDPEAVGVIVNRIAPFGGGYLRDLMAEAVTGRRADVLLTTPRWQPMLTALSLRLRRGKRT